MIELTRTFRRFYMLLPAILFLSLAGCAGGPKQESAGEYLDDSTITAKVKAAILSEPSLNVAEINVETFKGTVQLSGFVKDPKDVEKAVEVARHVRGVKSVKNDLRAK